MCHFLHLPLVVIFHQGCTVLPCRKPWTPLGVARPSARSWRNGWNSIYRVAQATGHLARFVVFGSFVTSKLAPNDVDVFLVMEDTFDATHLTGEAQVLFDHAAVQAYFGGSVFWLRRLATLGDEQSAIEDRQITRNGSRRGLIEIVLEVP